MLRLSRAMTRVAVVRAVALAVFAAGCTAGAGADSAVERDAISGATASGVEDDAVVEIVAHEPTPYDPLLCTGVLLAPDIVLTALHCVAVYDLRSLFSCKSDGTLDPNWSGGWIGEPLDPASIDVFFGAAPASVPDAHGARIFGTGSTAVCIDDLALVILDTALPNPGRRVRLKRPVVLGETTTIVSYGLNDLTDVGRARRTGVPVINVGPDDTSGDPGTAAPRTFVVGDGPCVGDDGMPASSDETGAVTGVLAYAFGGTCPDAGTAGAFTKVSAFEHLLAAAFDAAGEEPLEESATHAAPSKRAPGCAVGSRARHHDAAAGLFGALALLLARRRSARTA